MPIATAPPPTTRSRAPKLGELLVAKRQATRTAVQTVLDRSDASMRLGEALLADGLAEPEAVAETLAEQLRLPYAAPPLVPDANAVRLVRAELARRRLALPLSLEGRTVRVAMVDPLDHEAVSELEFHLGRRVAPVVVSSVTLGRAFTK